MAGPVLFDRVYETSTTTGTGNITLAGAATGFRAFDAVVSNGETFPYVIALQSGTEWETGIGTKLTSTTFSRSVIQSSNSNNLVNFSSGTKDVFLMLSSARTPALDKDNTFTIGPQTINLAANAQKGLIVKRFSSGHSANLLEIQNESGTSIASVSAAGVFTGNGSGLTSLTAANISAGTAGISITGNAGTVTNGVYTNVANTFTLGPQLLQSGGASNKVLLVRGAASQSANLQEWQNSGGTSLAHVTAAGVFNGDGSGLTMLQPGNIVAGTAGISITGNAGTVTNGVYTNVANTITQGPTTLNSGGAALVSLIVKGAASQSANLQEWQNSGGSVLANITAAGVFTGNGSGLTNIAGASFGTQTANFVFAGPTSGGAANPTFRALVSDDIPALAASKITSGVFPEARGGTNQSTYTLGDTLYASAANTLSKLAGNTTTTRQFLRQTGNGSVSAAPAWDTLVAGDIPALAYVTSVAITGPSIISWSGSPITSSGTFTGTLANQSANTVLAGPTSGGATTPTFRALVKLDQHAQTAYKDEANTFTLGPNTFQTGAAGNIGVIIAAAASQSANVLEIRNSVAAVIHSVDPQGATAINLKADSAIGLVIKRNSATHAANLFVVQDESGGTLTALNAGCTVLTMPASFAIGLSSAATGSSALAIGGSASAAGNNSTALGNTAAAGGTNATAIGATATCNQNNSVSIGTASVVNASNCVAIGRQAAAGGASASSATAIGANAQASTANSLAIGSASSVAQAGGTALGASAVVQAGHTNSLALGYQANSFAAAEFVVTPNVDFITFSVLSSTSTNRQRGEIRVANVDNTDASRKYRLTLSAFDTAAREGLRIEGSGTAALLSFFGITAVARASAYTQTYSTADKTHANPTAVAVTDNTGGTANTTLQNIGAAYSQAEVANNFADLAAQHNALVADLADLKQLCNSMIDDLQAYGLFQ